MRILIKFPSRSRPEKLINVTSRYVEYAEDMVNTRILITLDTDDSSITEEVKERLRAIHPNIHLDLGVSTSKVHAINRGMPNPSTFDILLLASDDMVPQVKGYDTNIRNKMQSYFPDTDGILFYNDGFNKNNLNTIVICGSKYYRRFGYIYYPEYKSLFCDNEFMLVGNILKRQRYFDEVIIRHEHPNINSSVPNDELYIRNDRYLEDDMKLYLAREKSILKPISPLKIKLPKVSIRLGV